MQPSYEEQKEKFSIIKKKPHHVPPHLHNAIERQLLLADEPTGNLDEEMAQEVTKILKESAHVHKKCVIVVTHSLEVAGEADVVMTLKSGKLLSAKKGTE